MSRGDAIKSVTHVADVNCYPCSGLNNGRATENGRRKSTIDHERKARTEMSCLEAVEHQAGTDDENRRGRTGLKAGQLRRVVVLKMTGPW